MWQTYNPRRDIDRGSRADTFTRYGAVGPSLMTKSPDDRLIGDVAREACQRGEGGVRPSDGPYSADR